MKSYHPSSPNLYSDIWQCYIEIRIEMTNKGNWIQVNILNMLKFDSTHYNICYEIINQLGFIHFNKLIHFPGFEVEPTLL